MKINNKHFLSVLLSGFLTLGASNVAQADVLSNAFDSVMSSHSPATSWKAAGRYGYVGRSGALKFRSKNINLINITPPTFSAGCGGISWSLGGFDFVDGEELVEFFQAAGQAAAGQVVLLAAKVLCEPCAQTLAYIQELSQMAASTSLDSCKFATSAVTAAFGKNPNEVNSGEKDSAVRGVCQEKESNNNDASSFYDAKKDGSCGEGSSLKDAIDGLNDILEGENDSTAEAELAYMTKSNPFWWAMKEAGLAGSFSDGIAYSSLSGSSELEKVALAEAINAMIYSSGNEESVIELNWETENWNSYKISVEDGVMSYMICGSDFDPYSGSSVYENPILTEYCELKKNAYENFKIATCSASGGDDTFMGNTCNPYGLEDANPNDGWFNTQNLVGATWSPAIAFETGLAEKVSEVFIKAYENIDNGESPVKDNDYLIFLLEVAPFDLYRVLNVATINPQAAKQITDSAELFIAFSAIKNYIETALANFNLWKEVNGVTKPIEISKGMQQTFHEIKGAFVGLNDFKSGMITDLHYQEMIMGAVVSIEQQVAKEVSVRQLRQGKKFKSAIVSPGSR